MPRTAPGGKRAAERVPAAPSPAQGVLQSADLAAWPLLLRSGPLTVKGSLTGTLGVFAFGNNQFALPPSQATTAYRNDPGWGEFFLEPGVTAELTLTPALSLYGGAAYMETATRGTDYAGVGNTYHGAMEQLYAGARWRDAARGLALDASYGQLDYTVGRSFLIANGASNGAQRGANFLDPRAAWANAALLKGTWGDFVAEAYWLKPNDSTEASTGTRLAGLNFEWNGPGPLRLAGMYVYAPESQIVTRDGLNVYNLRARWHPFSSAPHAWLQGEVVWERKSGVAAEGWYAAFNYNAQDTAWKPLLSLRYASLSGDDPATARWEGFDPLYYGGGNPDWYQGELASTLFDNTNLNSVAVSLTLAPDERNVLQFVLLDFRAARTNAPLALPAANQPVPAGGVPAKGLATELDAIWTYTFGKYVNVSAFAAYAWPGAGYRDLYARQGGSARNWSGAGMQVNISY